MPDGTGSLDELLKRLQGCGDEKCVSVGAVLEGFQSRSLGVSLTLLGLITILPIVGDIPGAAIVCATLALLAIVQSLRGTGTLWAPGFVRRRTMKREKFDRAIEAARPLACRVDRLLKPRLKLLAVGRPQHLMISAVAALLALSLYPLAFVPFGANAPGVGLIALGLGLMTGDGLLILIGYAVSGVTAYLLITAINLAPL